jgi:FAD/FMN-containing dehydrogenase
MGDICADLQALLGEDAVLDPARIAQRATSYWDQSPMRAAALVRPRDAREVSAVLALCDQRGQPVVTHGGLTGVVGGATARPTDVVLSLERMTSIEEIDPVGRTATVQAGVTLQRLQEAAQAHGLAFPVDLGARGSCTIGGNVATNAGGINVIRHGMMRDHVLGLEVVLADGTVITNLNRMVKNNAGYDVKQVFVGSEGTLGVITRVVVRLAEAPVSRSTALAALSVFDRAPELLRLVQRSRGGHLSAFEVMWGDYLREVTAPGWHRAPMDRDFPFYVLLESEGGDPESDRTAFLAVMERAVDADLLADAVIAHSEAERQGLWAIREQFESLFARKPLFLYDVSLPMREMEEYVETVQRRLTARWPDSRCDVMGHAGDGNLHLFVWPGSATGDGLHALSDVDVYEPLRAIGGSVSAEHGIGLEKREHLGISRSDAEIALMRTLKRTLDPNGILNPGKVLPPP